MATRTYTITELLTLRASPLVQKPDNLPSIEQWLEYVYLDIEGKREKLRIPHSESQTSQQGTQPGKQNGNGTGAVGRQQQRVAAGADASPMGNFSTGQRPSLIQTRSSARNGDDITLGPPKTMFSSSRNTSKLSDFNERTPADAANVDETDKSRGGRTFGDKQANRRSLNTGDPEARHNRESWTLARERRAQGVEEERSDGAERNSRYARRDKEREPGAEGRNGHGERTENRWGQRDDRRQPGERIGGWRERENQRRDGQWDRTGHAEKEPEWMDDPAPKQTEDFAGMGMPKNQEDFEKWKQAQHARTKRTTEVDDLPMVEPEPATKDVALEKSAGRMRLDGIVDKPFKDWTDRKVSEGGPDDSSLPAKASSGKSKTSRFMSMFKKDEVPEETFEPPAEPPKKTVLGPNGSVADKEGFDRILQMLGGTGISQPATPAEPSSPQPKAGSQGAKSKSRFTGFFDQTPKSPERSGAPQETTSRPFNPMDHDVRAQGARGIPEDHPARQMPFSHTPPNVMSPGEQMNANAARESRPPSGRMNEIFLDPPSRGVSTPDLNIQNLLATQRSQRQQGPDKNSEFLLNLLQTKGSSRPPSQQARPDNNNFPLWLDQSQNGPETHAPKPHAPAPPGLFEEQLLRHAPQDGLRNEPPQHQQMPPKPGPDMLQRRTSQRMPPGFYDERNVGFPPQPPQQQSQRRNFTEPPQQHNQAPGRRMSNLPNLAQMQPPPPMPPFPPGEYLQSPGAHQQAAPPGFNPHMPRHPPGFHNIPNIFQAPQPPPPMPPQFAQQQQQQPRDMMGPPFAGGGAPGGVTSPLNAPPGFFSPPPPPGGPPGMAPPGFMQMRPPPTEGGMHGVPNGAPPGMRSAGKGFEGFEAMGPRR